MQKITIDGELNARILKNRMRLCEKYYQIDEVFQDSSYDWQGDKEGRALLAFVSHYKISGDKIPCMEKLISQIPQKTNEHFFFGAFTGDVIFEQQLSGHNWYLRGLCEYYEQFKDAQVLKFMSETVKYLYYPTIGKFSSYPVNRIGESGGVSGHSAEIRNGWQLSTDVGCAFMSIDGLSHYYQITKDYKVKQLLDEMIFYFLQIDKRKIKAQTHCTLTAVRGMLRLYQIEKNNDYLNGAKQIYNLYRNYGMTLTYQNFNWWDKGDTWTEPCAVVDSVMIAATLFQITGEKQYHEDAVRIYHNGFATVQRPNGGAGTDTTVSETTLILKAKEYEAYFCCTMRLAEGLWFLHQNPQLYTATIDNNLVKDEYGRYWNGDLIYAELNDSAMGKSEQLILKDKHKLFPLVKLFLLTDEQAMALEQKIIFK